MLEILGQPNIVFRIENSRLYETQHWAEMVNQFLICESLFDDYLDGFIIFAYKAFRRRHIREVFKFLALNFLDQTETNFFRL